MLTASEKLFEEVDGLIKAGRTHDAKLALKRYRDAKIPVSELKKFASLARRLGMASLGVRMLSPVVHPTGRVKSESTPEDRLEYGACLVRLGAISEARALLDPLDAKSLPWVNFIKALACFYVWDYASAVPMLKTYLESPDLNDYQKATARANLAAALVDIRAPEAESFMSRFIPELREKKFDFLLMHALIIEGERGVYTGEQASAGVALDEARKIALEKSPREVLLIDKWFAILKLQAKGKAALSDLHEVRARALKNHEWETVRNCDFHQATILKDESLFKRVYFGTPFPSLRQALVNDFGKGTAIPEAYSYRGDHSKTVSREIDLGQVEKGRVRGLSIKTGNAGHRLLTILLTDFYKPFRTVPLHDQLFPGQFYNPDSSPQRVQKTVRRLRMAFEEGPFRIVHNGHGYRLVVEPGVSVRIAGKQTPKSREEGLMSVLLQTFQNQPSFSAQEASDQTGIGIWNCRKLLKTAKDRGWLEQIGKGPAARYRILAVENTSHRKAS